MSRGFVKEDDQEEIPFVIPRAHLTFGVVNYVTSNGMELLKQEQKLLFEEQKKLEVQSDDINRVQINYLKTKLRLLVDRINSAKVVDLSNQIQNEIHFGATITLFKKKENCTCQYQIVGVDEANASQNKVSFLSPIAKILLNKNVGDSISLPTPKGERILKVEVIEYK